MSQADSAQQDHVDCGPPMKWSFPSPCMEDNGFLQHKLENSSKIRCLGKKKYIERILLLSVAIYCS